jgi:hypothetical protein
MCSLKQQITIAIGVDQLKARLKLTVGEPVVEDQAVADPGRDQQLRLPSDTIPGESAADRRCIVRELYQNRSGGNTETDFVVVFDNYVK